jgi:hypothetical protein
VVVPLNWKKGSEMGRGEINHCSGDVVRYM